MSVEGDINGITGTEDMPKLDLYNYVCNRKKTNALKIEIIQI